MLRFVALSLPRTQTHASPLPREPQVLAVMAMKWVLAEWGAQPQFGRRPQRSQPTSLCVPHLPIFGYSHLFFLSHPVHGVSFFLPGRRTRFEPRCRSDMCSLLRWFVPCSSLLKKKKIGKMLAVIDLILGLEHDVHTECITVCQQCLSSYQGFQMLCCSISALKTGQKQNLWPDKHRVEVKKKNNILQRLWDCN